MLVKGIVHSGEALETQDPVMILKKHSSVKEEDVFFHKLMDSFEKEMNNEFVDPISYEIMKDPVVVSSGHVFDRSSIFDESGKMKFNKCPITRQALE